MYRVDWQSVKWNSWIKQKIVWNTGIGFKEHKTKALIQDYLKKEGFTISKEYFETGFEITIGSGKPHIGLICELDAIPTQGHRCADPVDHAAHSCGHSTQVGIMLSAITALKKLDAVKNGGTITLFFTPAEEFCDLGLPQRTAESR